MRTLIDWIDQAILIQRFPDKVSDLRGAGYTISAVDFAWMSPSNNKGSKDLATMVADTLQLNPEVIAVAMDNLFQDSYVRILWSLWQNEGRDDGRPTP